MGFRNRIEEGKMYFLTLTVVDWVDVFTRPNHKLTIVEALKFCQERKGLELYAWVLMSNHLHLIASAKDGLKLPNILRDFKQFTAKKILKAIEEEPESRRQWMLHRFAYHAKFRATHTYYKFWKDGNEPKEIFSHDFMMQKLEYIHQNPVVAMLVHEPEDYVFSSAVNYSDKAHLALLEVEGF